MTTIDSRLFLACVPTAHVRDDVAERARAVLGSSLERVYAAEDLHLTLVFLGHVDAERAQLVEAGMARAFGDAAPISLRVGGTGSFATAGREHALWAGFELGVEANARLLDLVARGRQLAAESGIALAARDAAQPFVPHLTLARPRPSEVAPRDFARLAFDLDWRADEVVLCASVGAGRPGGRYPVRARVRLCGS